MIITPVVVLLMLHALVGVALLGAVTHQMVSMYWRKPARGGSFFDRYTGVDQRTFVIAVVVLYVAQLVLGALIYPSYRLNARIPFEDMFLFKAVGVFELKEHFGGIGLGLLPLYVWLWRPDAAESHRRERFFITSILAFIVWWAFIIGHFLNNIRGVA